MKLNSSEKTLTLLRYDLSIVLLWYIKVAVLVLKSFVHYLVLV